MGHEVTTEAVSGDGEMTICKEERVANSEESKYASTEDFRKAFSDDIDALYRLSFLLTGDHEKAEQCFFAGVEDSRRWAAELCDRVGLWPMETSRRYAPGWPMSTTVCGASILL